MATDPELEEFKTRINLTEYAAAEGYCIIRRESSHNSIAMKHPTTGDKIVIARNDNSHWIYFSINDTGDKGGSIIDFVQNRQGGHLGAVRGTLRQFLGSPPLLPPGSYAARVEKSSKDRQSILRVCFHLHQAEEQPYLQTRAIGNKDLLTHPRFAGRLYHDPKHGAACFLYEDGQGICGVEMRNEGFKGFAPGSEKGLWRSNCFKEDQNLVLTEGVINGLSYAVLYPANHTRYMALGGGWSDKTRLLIESAAKKHPGQTITLAFDNDTQGQKYAADTQQIIAKTGKQIQVHFPDTPGIDWNEQLTNILAQEQHQHRKRLEKSNETYRIR